MGADKLLGSFVIRGTGPCHSRMDLIDQVIDHLYAYKQNLQYGEGTRPYGNELRVDVAFEVANMPASYEAGSTTNSIKGDEAVKAAAPFPSRAMTEAEEAEEAEAKFAAMSEDEAPSEEKTS